MAEVVKKAVRVRAICLVRQRVYYFASKTMGSLLGRKSFQGRLQAKSPPLLFAWQKIGEVGRSPGGVEIKNVVTAMSDFTPTNSQARSRLPVRC